MNFTTEICNSFNKYAHQYDAFAKVQLEIGERLFSRLELIKLTPSFILDLGCGTGSFLDKLKKKYPLATVIGLDLALQMLIKAKQKQRWWKKNTSLLAGDMLALPFADGVFDLVFSNQTIHWSSSLPLLKRELNRVMNKNGCLMFSTLGPDTFSELKGAWGEDNYAHMNEFKDMHDLGDILLEEYFIDPVMDMEKLQIHYKDATHLMTSLKAQGVKNINPKRNPGLTGKNNWKKFIEQLAKTQTREGKYPLTYEVLYGHAWKGNQHKTSKGVETFIPVSRLSSKNLL